MRKIAALLAGLIVLAGCSDDKESSDDIVTGEDCAEQGLELQDVNGTLACGPPRPPATLRIEGLPGDVGAYGLLSFSWVLETHLPENHAMLTEVRVATASVPDAQLAGPDTFGESVAKQEHQDFTSGQSYSGELRPDAEGTLHFRAYALVQGEDLWSPEVVVNVTAVAPTDVVHDVTIPPGSAVQGVDPATVEAALGDGVRFVNGDVLPRNLVFTGPAEVGPVSVQPQASSEPVVFLVPGTYTYMSDEAAGSVSGTVSVALP